MPGYVWATIAAMGLVTAMWYSPEWFKRYNNWRHERKERRERAQWVSDWLVSREQMREDRHREGLDKRDGL